MLVIKTTSYNVMMKAISRKTMNSLKEPPS